MKSPIKGIFFELIQVSLGNKKNLERIPSEVEWSALLDMACKQSLVGYLFRGVEKAFSEYDGSKPEVLFEWFGIQQETVTQNHLHNRRVRQLVNVFKDGGMQSCVLKGQGTAQYYDILEYRQCGDIDLWVQGDRDRILAFARSNGYTINSIDQKHSDIAVFEDVPVEVHFKPSWMYNPFGNIKLQRFFNGKAERQFGNIDEKAGFVHTTVDFDLVFSMVHIFRHIFSEGVGLRQLMDYYFILKNSTEDQRKEAYDVIRALGMSRFAGGVMWILRERFGLDETLMLCKPNERHGKYQLEEIMQSGNFGQYDERTVRVDKNKRFKRGLVQLKRNLRFVGYYPSEVLWSPVWKLWHYCWRKRKGYI